MNTFNLKVIASNKDFYEGKCEILVVPAMDGELAIMAHHQDMVLATKVGNIRFRDDKGNNYEAIVGIGFVHIANNRVTVLIDTIELPDEIDEVRANLALERAKEKLRQKQSIQEYHINQASLSRAINRLKISHKRSR